MLDAGAPDNFINLYGYAAATFLAPNTDQITPQTLLQGLHHTKQELERTLASVPEEIELQEDQAVSLACTKKCDHCCSYRVTTLPLELFAIAQDLKNTHTSDQLNQLIQELETYNQKRANQYPHEVILNIEPCPLLTNHLCRVYEIRPFTCIDYHSFDLQKCIEDKENPIAGANVPQDPLRKTITAIFINAVNTALEKLNLNQDEVEFIPGLLIALKNPDAATLYSQGQNPFEEAIRPDLQAAQQAIYKQRLNAPNQLRQAKNQNQ